VILSKGDRATMRQRWILHADMDAFYASVEQRDNPELSGKPVIVGGSSNRGVVCAASYEARKFGVRSAMSIVEAKRRCSHGIFLMPNINKYAEVSSQILQIFESFSPIVETLALDEAFLDITGMELLHSGVADIALQIKERVRDELWLSLLVLRQMNSWLSCKGRIFGYGRV
jgi:DNA polymerase-4